MPMRRPRAEDMATRIIVNDEQTSRPEKVRLLQGLGWLCCEIDQLLGMELGSAKRMTISRWQHIKNKDYPKEHYKHE